MKKTLLLLLLASCSTLADLGHVNLIMSGEIMKESCDIDANNLTQNVEIGDFAVGTFNSVGSVSADKSFKILLSKCSPEIKTAGVTFTGTAQAGGDSSLLALSDTTGTGNLAQGVAVQLLDSNKIPLAINSLNPVRYPISPGDNTLNFSLRYKAVSLPVVAGNANAVLYFNMDYQ
ncbi:S-fimbrial protein subunit SfaG precursor [Buttiauxella agrestis]|uniref:S-fimbrial protein subunit SfaG n=1 Tax=Buttiauxella agrestis TaxID=82977 RepID=A0A381KNP4_9ENTR|nr:fimbrial protein [Buttiauxella agrestis]SUY92929.1 S-fimbrial protein subunit SfaG precursor [Buttiauxella agrestis]